MSTDWFQRRTYRHFDAPVGKKFAARVMSPAFVATHSFSPLIHYEKLEKRYKKCAKPECAELTPKCRLIKTKSRPIKYASHRDACILSYYAHRISHLLDQHYRGSGLSDSVIAYRALGKSNYAFAAEALNFARANSPVIILAFDVAGFFDNLDHRLLKARLKCILGMERLSEDWFKVFRNLTRFHYVDLEELRAHPIFGPKLTRKGLDPVASVAQLKDAGIKFHKNPTRERGIPQGTPISAALSNLYLLDFDAAAKTYCDGIGAMYRRYSDDILVACSPGHATAVEIEIRRLMAAEKLELSPDKTERTHFDIAANRASRGHGAQYLGFNLGEGGATIRHSSLSRQWRKMRRAFKRTRKVAQAEIAAGRASKVWTKKLRRRFTALQFRNFSSYGRRSATAFGPDEKITKQIRRFELAAERELDELGKL